MVVCILVHIHETEISCGQHIWFKKITYRDIKWQARILVTSPGV